MLLAVLQIRVALLLFRALLGVLLGVDVLDLDALAVEHPALGLRVLGRHGIAVVTLAVLVDPAVVGPVLGCVQRAACQAQCERGDDRGDFREMRHCFAMRRPGFEGVLWGQLSTMRRQGQVSQSATP